MHVNTSATKLNKIGDTGSPCLTPLLVSKKALLTSLILTPTEPLFNKDWMRYMHLGLKPLCFSILSKKLLSTLSYAFS
jgi:hypothetical protein